MVRRRGMGARKSRRWYTGGVGASVTLLVFTSVFFIYMTLRSDSDATSPAPPPTVGVGTFRPTNTRVDQPLRHHSDESEALLRAPEPPAGKWNGVSKEIPSKPRSELDIHIVFSTDCSAYQNFQSTLLFHSAETVGHMGRISRVASGCSEEEIEELRQFMARQPDRFRVHFTPDYSYDEETDERYVFYNKPNGMAHFLRHADPPVSEAVIALVDPDMILMSPLTPNVGNRTRLLWLDKVSAEGSDWVEEGHPVGQLYGLGGGWAEWDDLGYITRELGPNSPANKLSVDEARAGYAVGPPYLLHTRDWVKIIDTWVKMCPRVNKKHPGILAEMYGFCIAAAHFRLPHRVTRGLMVSNPIENSEGWDFVDELGEGACDPAVVEARQASLPPTLHFCQMYRVGSFMFGKRQARLQSFFTCCSDALEVPPPQILSGPMARYRYHPHRREEVHAGRSIRDAYMMCTILRSLNRAQAAFKQRYCEPNEIAGGEVKRLTDLIPKRMEEAEKELAEMSRRVR